MISSTATGDIITFYGQLFSLICCIRRKNGGKSYEDVFYRGERENAEYHRGPLRTSASYVLCGKNSQGFFTGKKQRTQSCAKEHSNH
jgi:hypothetical protein